MAVEILVRAENVGNVLTGLYGKGFPVVACKSPWNWGGEECPPKFVRVNIPDANEVADVNNVMQEWRRKTTYEILHFDVSVDFFRVRIFADPAISTSNPVAQVTVSEMQQFLLDWGAEKVEVEDAEPGVLFEITAMDGVTSRGLFTFGEEDVNVTYTEISYDQLSGIHTVELDYSNSSLTEQTIMSILQQAQLEVKMIGAGICTFEAQREKMIKQLERQVAEKFDKMIARARYRFTDSLVDSALSGTGTVDLALADIDDNLVDVSEEV